MVVSNRNLLFQGLFSGDMLVSGRVGSWLINNHRNLAGSSKSLPVMKVFLNHTLISLAPLQTPVSMIYRQNLKNHLIISNHWWEENVQDASWYQLVDGFNPLEQYYRPIGSFPQIGVKINNISSHHLANIHFPNNERLERRTRRGWCGFRLSWFRSFLKASNKKLVPQTTILEWMLVETPILIILSYNDLVRHPTETNHL